MEEVKRKQKDTPFMSSVNPASERRCVSHKFDYSGLRSKRYYSVIPNAEVAPPSITIATKDHVNEFENLFHHCILP